VPLVFFRCNFYKYWHIFIIFRAQPFVTECQSHRRKNFLPHVGCVATIPCESIRHKSNTFHTILALCTCLYRSHLQKTVSMKQTKHSRKSEAQNWCSKCPPFTRTHAVKRLRHCAIAAVMMVWSGSLDTTPSADVLSTLSHHGSANGRPLLKYTTDAVFHRIQIWRIGCPHSVEELTLASLSLSLSLYICSSTVKLVT